ncbi:MAG: hypothetical protein EPN93_05630 [Spirochaetes bacterium]|nr:MAG: hypothetical protein EPN93_05630 [Spirochaetota bacterium]
MKILLLADIHGAADMLRRAEEPARAADVVVLAGDITKGGSADEARALLDIMQPFAAKLLAVHGNWDSEDVRALFEERGISLHADARVMGDTGFFGVGGSTTTPMHTRVEYAEEEIAGFLAHGYAKLAGVRHIVLVSHTPPHRTRDRTFLGIRAGSRAVRAFIEQNRVDLCLCGHIHEAGGVESLGTATIANPGSFKKGKYIYAETGSDVRVSRGRIRMGFRLFR